MSASAQRRIDYATALAQLAPPVRAKWLEGFADLSKFCPLSLSIVNKDGMRIPFRLNRGQRKFLALAEQQRREQGYIRIVAPKARQVGVSTIVGAQNWQHCVFHPGRNGMVFAHTEDASKSLFRNYYVNFQTHYRQFGPFVLPELVSDTDRRLLYDNGSSIQCFTGGNADALNSFRSTYIHFSEFALMDQGAALLENANATLPLRPGTALVVESSARGVGTPFHNLVQRARGGKTHWGLYFFGWTEHEEYELPLPTSPSQFEKSLTSEEKDLRQQYQLTHGQILWRRVKIDEFNGNLDKFRQEFPATVDEAFLGSGRSYFVPSVVQKAYVPLPGEDGVIASEVLGGRETRLFRVQRGGPVRIFRRPVRGELFVCGADPAAGVDPSMKTHGRSDPDYTTAIILDARSGDQVARLRVRETPIASARLVADLCRYYNHALLNPEANMAGFVEGLVQDEYPSELILPRDPRADVEKSSRTIHQMGWLTTKSSRADVLASLETAFYDGLLTIRDSDTYGELMSFVIKQDGRPEHDSGCHDDLVFALALAANALRRAKRVYETLRRMHEMETSITAAKPIRVMGRIPRFDADPEVDVIRRRPS